MLTKLEENCVLFEGRTEHEFGSNLSREEQEWLVDEIKDFLQQFRLQENLENPETKLLD